MDGGLLKGGDRRGAVKCRRSAFARNIAERKTKTADAVRKKIVEISSQSPRWNVSSREIEARHFPGAGRQKLALDFPRGIEIVPKLPFALARFFIEPGGFQLDGYIGAKSGQHAFVFQGE